MSTYQKVIIVGHLGNEPLTKHFDNGQLTNITIATSERWTDKMTGEKKELTEWHKVVLRGKLSELADKWLKRGSKVLVEGKIRTRKYLGQDGTDRYVTEIFADSLNFMGTSSETSTNNTNNKETKESIDEYKDKEESDDLPF